MATDKGRQAWVNLSYMGISKGHPVKRGKDVMKEFMESFVYSDCATGSMDTVSVVLDNTDSRFSKGWMPKKKDHMAAFIVTDRWGNNQKKKEKMHCGNFMVDTIRFSAPPSLCEIGAISAPEISAFRTTERERTWKKATLHGIARIIASRYKLKILFKGSDVNVGTLEQSGETDHGFLEKTAESYGYGMKLYRGRIFIYSIAEMESAKPSCTIHRYQVIGGYDWETSMTGTYTGAKIRYTDEKSKEVSCTVGKGPRWLRISESADSIAQARKLAAAKVNNENRGTTTMSLTIRGDIRYYSTSTVVLQGFNKLSGIYFIDKAEHRIDASQGYTTQLTMHKVQKRITA